jgi:hypothetical protein
MFKSGLSIWHMLLPSLGLHGLLLAYPIDSKRDLETTLKPGKPVRVIRLPPAPLRKVTQPIAIKSAQPLPKIQNALPLQPKRTIIIQTITSPVPQAKPPVSTPQPSPSPSPSPAASVSPSSSADFQLDGATASCNGEKDCYALEETNGRLVSARLEQRLQRQGYVLKALDLENEHGMTAYQLLKSGHPQDYLYVFWSDKGTTYLRSPVLLSYEAFLKLIART